MGHKFKPANWERLLGKERHALLDPVAFVRGLGIAPGATVADIGAGPGFFTGPLADAVGGSGRVHALDVSPEMVALLHRQERAPQVTAHLSEESRLPLPDASVDLALLAFVFHELDSPLEFLEEGRRILRARGRLAVLEWVPQEEAMGPPVSERVSVDVTRAALERAGLEVVDDGLANASNYYVIGRRP
jgi:ubiquinone/menaquinone biosynthesis C-methylase UbiE